MLDGRGGEQAYTNVDHVRLAVEMAEMAGREIASPDEARAILGMPSRAQGKLTGPVETVEDWATLASRKLKTT